MDELKDDLRPSKIDVERIYAQSSQRWSFYAKKSSLQSGFSPDSLRLQNMLGSVPSYLGQNLVGFRDQDKPEFDLRTIAQFNNLSALYINGTSLWSLGEGDCDLKEKTISHQLILGIQRSISCSFTNDGRFANWPELPEHQMSHSRDGNCLSILVFAWSYILSAHWIEMQRIPGSNDRLVYLSHQAGWRDDSSETLQNIIDVNLGDLSDDAARWWAAILAKDEGWRAEIERNESVYRSPWSTTSISANHQFRLRRKTSPRSSYDPKLSPPSSDVALGYLSDFCLLQNAGSQCSAALAAALTFPSLTEAVLPLPTSCDLGISSSPPSRDSSEKEEMSNNFRLLPYYMTLSCSRRGIESLLCNTFFDPYIPCNLVGPWIQPIFEVLDPLITKRDYKNLAMVLGMQQPKIAALWTGALITGMAQNILQYCRSGSIAIEIHSAAWTNTIQTFMSLDPQPLADFDQIFRTDECRLLYLAGEEYNSRIPICPWRPFGTTALSDTDICVREHAHCKGGHYLRYAGWSWALKNSEKVWDTGFCSDTIEQNSSTTLDDTAVLGEHKYKDTTRACENISESATRSIFGWLRSYGWPAAEKVIYTHSWIVSESYDDSDDDLEDDVSDPGKVKYTNDKFERIAAWLDQCVQESEGA